MQMENMVFFLAELGLMNYQISISYSPSTIASAAVYVARCTLEKNPIWTATLHHHTGYVEEELKYINKLPWKFFFYFFSFFLFLSKSAVTSKYDLIVNFNDRECAELLVNLHRGAVDSKLKAVYRKYTSLDRRAVSLLPPAKSSTPDCSPEV